MLKNLKQTRNSVFVNMENIGNLEHKWTLLIYIEIYRKISNISKTNTWRRFVSIQPSSDWTELNWSDLNDPTLGYSKNASTSSTNNKMKWKLARLCDPQHYYLYHKSKHTTQFFQCLIIDEYIFLKKKKRRRRFDHTVVLCLALEIRFDGR